VGCVTCLAHLCPIGFECLAAVSTEEVYDGLRSVIKEKIGV
jgi:hypothetical protein